MTTAALTAAELARLLRVNPATLAAHLESLYADGLPRPRWIGRCRRWSAAAVEDWLAHRGRRDAPSGQDKMLARIDAL